MKLWEKKLLKKLLGKVATESEGKSENEPNGRPAGFIPETALNAFYKLTRTPFLEIVIYRKCSDGRFEYLCQDRHDQWWNGFSVFGGMVQANFSATPIGVAQRIIDREFKNMGITVRTLRIVSFFNWPEHHPWCNPFAVVCLLQVNGEISEGGNRHWLRADALPGNMVINQREYLEQCEWFLETGGKALTFTPSNPYGIPIDVTAEMGIAP